MTKTVRAFAQVEVTLLIATGSTWGGDCSVDQVHRQAVEDALSKLSRATNGTRDFQVIGKPKVVRVQSVIED